jgi:hypothetical protein
MTALVAAPPGGDAHADDPRGTETRSTVGAPLYAVRSTPRTSEPSEPRISIPASDGIVRHGGRPRRMLTGLLVCGICDAQLRASPRTRHETQWLPVPGSKLNAPHAYQYSQPRYVCPTGHLAIIGRPLEQLIKAAVAADRPGDTLAGAIVRIIVFPGRPGCNSFDVYRLRFVYRDPTIRTTPLRLLYESTMRR